MSTTQQDTGKHIPNPTGKGGFGDHPENRNPGGWKKEESISYQYNLIGRMSDEELENFVPKTQFQKIALARVKQARDERYGLPDAKELADRTEGKPSQAIDMTSKGESINVLAVEFVNGNNTNTDKDS